MITKTRLVSLCYLTPILILCLADPSVQARDWDDGGGDSDWTNQLNWQGDMVPFAEPATVINGTAIIMSQSFPVVPEVTQLEVGRPNISGTMIIDGNTANASINVLGPAMVRPLGTLELTTSGGNTATLTSAAPLSNEGSILINGGGTIDPAGAYLQSDGQTVLAGGMIDAPLTHIIDGSLAGDGDVLGDLYIGGLPSAASPQLSPGGAGIGEIHATGDLELRDNSVLNIDIDATGQNPLSDLVSVDGTATLGGTLNLNISGSISYQDRVTILVSDEFTKDSAFLNVTANLPVVPVLDDSLPVPTLSLYTTTEGDMNGDGSVNNLDARLFAWAIRDVDSYLDVFDPDTEVPGNCEAPGGCRASQYPVNKADMDGDRHLTGLDVHPFLMEVEQSFGSSAVAENIIANILAGNSIPEPSAVSLVAVLLFVAAVAGRYDPALSTLRE